MHSLGLAKKAVAEQYGFIAVEASAERLVNEHNL